MAEFCQKFAPEPCILVLFGATGDLARRKLFPAVYNLYLEGLLPDAFVLMGLGRRFGQRQEFIDSVSQSIKEYSRQFEAGRLGEFLSHLEYLQMDINNTDSFVKLKTALAELDVAHNTRGNHLYYLSVGPDQFAPIIDQLKVQGMTTSSEAWRRVIIEKPFGFDLVSARALNAKITEAFPEKEIFRIDHYLGKGMLQNIQVIRFANSVFENLWNYRYIDHVQIRASETGGIADRGPYYDRTGALRDMVQNHLLQSLTLIAMEPPLNLSAEAIRDEKVKVLRSLLPMEEARLKEDVVRGQYEGYHQEERVSPESTTETFVALKVFVNNFRWAGVPFYLRTGKKMAEKSVEIVVQFKNLPGVLYFDGGKGLAPNILAIKVQPQEGLAFQFNAKAMATQEEIIPVNMDFCQNCAGEPSPEAYERLLYDAICGDSTLFTRWDEVEYSWQFIDTIAEGWKRSSHGPVIYPQGSWGPKEADQLLKKDGRRWYVI